VVFTRLSKHIKNVQQNYSEADKRLEKTKTTFENLLSSSSTDSPIENPQTTLALSDPEDI
jgi:hypothetical protein